MSQSAQATAPPQASAAAAQPAVVATRPAGPTLSQTPRRLRMLTVGVLIAGILFGVVGGACFALQASALSKAGATGTIGPSLNDLASSSEIQGSPEEYVRQSLLEPDAVVTQGFQPGVMPSFQGKLTDKQIQTLVQYLLQN